MERLTKRTSVGIVGNNDRVKNYPLHTVAKSDPLDHGITGQCFERLADYEDLEEQGLLLRLPCKVGTNIYIINHHWIDEGVIYGLAECDDVDCACFRVYEDPDTYTMVAFDEFGVTWFLTQAEAEQALADKGVRSNGNV